MDSKKMWNTVVDDFESTKFKKEEIVQVIWESNLRKTFMENDCKIARQKVPEGSTKKTDIVIKRNENIVAVVELKQHTYSRNTKAGQVTPQEQLFSYLNQLKFVNIGILVCDKLYVYAYDFTKSDDENSGNCLEIPFEKDSELGVKFVELFSKKQFDSEKVQKFILENVRQANDILEIQNQLEKEDFILELVKKHFAEKYDAQIIEKSIAEYVFECRRKNQPAPILVPPTDPNAMSKTGGTPEIEFKINGTVVEAGEFKKKLLQTKRAKRTWIFADGKIEKNIWDAFHFSHESDLKVNIKTSLRYRHWKQNGLVKVIFEINE